MIMSSEEESIKVEWSGGEELVDSHLLSRDL